MENTIKLMIKENGLSKNEAVSMVNNLINNRINSIKCDYMRAWERNHSACMKETNNKIAKLREEETRIINDIKGEFNQNSNNEIGMEVRADFANA